MAHSDNFQQPYVLSEIPHSSSSEGAIPLLSRLRDPKPNQPHDPSQQNRSRCRKLKPHATNKTSRRHNHPPRISSQRRAILKSLINEPNLPKPIHSRIHEPHRRRIDTAQTRREPPVASERLPQTHRAGVQCQARGEDGDVTDHGAGGGGEVG